MQLPMPRAEVQQSVHSQKPSLNHSSLKGAGVPFTWLMTSLQVFPSEQASHPKTCGSHLSVKGRLLRVLTDAWLMASLQEDS